MKKILVVNTVDFIFGGITSVIVNYYKYIDKNIFQIDFVINGILEKEFEELFKENNSHIYRVNRKKNPIKYFFQLKKILDNGNYEAIHIHGNSATMTIELLAAKLARCPIRIAHSHNSVCNHKLFHVLLSPLFKKLYTSAIACSEVAGNWIFGKGKFKVLPNGIEVDKYRFSINVRKRVREELSIENKLVIGHVGLMNEQKNHSMLFEIVGELNKMYENIHLLCVTGSESVPNDLEAMIKEMDIEQNITILHKRDDVNELLQAMDIFLLPSKWEGLPVVLVEAQAAGLPCIVSSVVSEEAKILKERYFAVPLEKEKWLEACKMTEMIPREKYDVSTLEERGFDIEKNIEILMKIYDING